MDGALGCTTGAVCCDARGVAVAEEVAVGGGGQTLTAAWSAGAYHARQITPGQPVVCNPARA